MKLHRIGLVFAYPWSDNWSRPSFVRWSRGSRPMRKVALSFGRFAFVFDITWYIQWMSNAQDIVDYGK